MLYVIVLVLMIINFIPAMVGMCILLAISSFDFTIAFITRGLVCYRGFDIPGVLGSKAIGSNLDEIAGAKGVRSHDLITSTANALCGLTDALHRWDVRLIVTDWLIFTPMCIRMYKSLLLSYTCRLMRYTSKEY